MFDPEVAPPPQTGEDLLLLNSGGRLITGPWSSDCAAWAYKPKVPLAVKARLSVRWTGIEGADRG
jgi:hypothetical protein